MARQRQIIVMCGSPETGKTTQILEMLSKQKQRCLIFDINKEAKYNLIPSIGINELEKFTGVKKIFTPNTNNFLSLCEVRLRNALLILEDASYYVEPHKNSALWKILVSRRHIGLDVVMTFHSLSYIPAWVYPMTNYLVLFKTADNPERSKIKIPKYDEIKENFLALKAHPNKYANSVIKII